MKLSYTWAEVERWRNKVHRRLPRLAIQSKSEAMDFINSVGFCLAFRSETGDLPSIWDASTGSGLVGDASFNHNGATLSYARHLNDIIPSGGKIFYGKLIKRRPTIVSPEFVPYFYVLSNRSGAKDEYITEHVRGRLSATAKTIMDALSHDSPLPTKELKGVVAEIDRKDRVSFERAMTELQSKMFVTKVVENRKPFANEWGAVRKLFARQVQKASRISGDSARVRILEKYFQNQLIASVMAIWTVFGWQKQIIYRTLGELVHRGIIASNIKLNGHDRNFYCLIH